MEVTSTERFFVAPSNSPKIDTNPSKSHRQTLLQRSFNSESCPSATRDNRRSDRPTITDYRCCQSTRSVCDLRKLFFLFAILLRTLQSAGDGGRKAINIKQPQGPGPRSCPPPGQRSGPPPGPRSGPAPGPRSGPPPGPRSGPPPVHDRVRHRVHDLVRRPVHDRVRRPVHDRVRRRVHDRVHRLIHRPSAAMSSARSSAAVARWLYIRLQVATAMYFRNETRNWCRRDQFYGDNLNCDGGINALI